MNIAYIKKIKLIKKKHCVQYFIFIINIYRFIYNVSKNILWVIV